MDVITVTIESYKDFIETLPRMESNIVIASKEYDILIRHDDEDVGIDLYSLEDVTFTKPHETKIVKTGVKTATPIGIMTEVRPRGSTALKLPVLIANSPGTVDPGYRGDVSIITQYTGNGPFTIKKGTRYAQMVFTYYIPVIRGGFKLNNLLYIYYIVNERVYDEFDKLLPSRRGVNAFGHTGGYDKV